MWRRLRHRLAFRRPDGERGSILVLASVATVVAVAAVSLGVDLSKAVATKRKLQTIADLAALDAVQSLASPPKAYTAQQLAKASLVNNGYDAQDTSPCDSYCVDVGQYPDPATGGFTVTADVTKQNAVRVKLTSTKAWAIAPGSKTYTATGIAKVRTDAGIAIGSFLLRADTTQSVLDSVLGGMLGGTTTIDAVSYRGLADTQVTLAELRSGLHVSAGTVDDFLNTQFKLKDVLTATATALTAEGNPTAAATVNGLALTASSSLMVKLGDMITVAQGGAAALSSQINAFQLVQGSIQLANKSHLLTVSLPLLSVGGLASASADITVIEAPQIAIGPAKQVSGSWVTNAKTAQVNTTLHARLLGSLLDVPVALQAASASAELRGITCNTPPTVSHTNPVHTTTSALAAQLGPVTLAGIGTVTTNTSVANSTSDLDFTGFPADMSPGLAGQRFDWTNKKTVGSSVAGSTISTGLRVTNLGVLLNGLANTALAPVFNLLDVLLDPLHASIGVTIGGADVWAWDLNCNARTLVN